MLKATEHQDIANIFAVPQCFLFLQLQENPQADTREIKLHSFQCTLTSAIFYPRKFSMICFNYNSFIGQIHVIKAEDTRKAKQSHLIANMS